VPFRGHKLPVSSMMRSVVAGAVCVAIISAAAFAGPASPNREWASIHGDSSNQRYAPLDQINLKSIGRLGAVWVSEPFTEGAMSRMTPLVHDGLMFLAAGPRIIALDARTGKQVWAHQTETRRAVRDKSFVGDPSASEQASGLAITRAMGLGLGGGMIFAGLMNGHVIALNEKSGDLVWDKVFNDAPLPIATGIVCVPLYIDGILYFGFGHEFVQGHAVAVVAKTGETIWRAPLVPEPGQPGHESWPNDNEVWRSGDSEPWASPAADGSLGLVYFATANPGPPSGGKIRRGDNLYSVALLAVEMKTGKIRWYNQLVHHDVWEADLSVPPILFDKDIDGHSRKAVAVIRGDGYVFQFDRVTGEPLIPIDERPVPQNPELFTAATQPFPRGADSILGPCENWKTKIPTGFVLGCMFDPPSHDVRNRLAQFASVRIAPMSFDPKTHYFYAQGTNSLMWQGDQDDPYVWITNINGARVPNYPRNSAVVAAVDSRTDKVVWTKELPSFDDSGYRCDGGSLSTAGGLVFHQGGDGTLQAYDAKTGETLWRFQTDYGSGDASPMSYSVDGKQYVAFVAGPKLWAFALGGAIPQAAAIRLPPQEEVTGPIEDTNHVEVLSLEPAFGHGHRYHLNEFAFNPYRARVRAGSSVKFINNGNLPHTIVAPDGSWETTTLQPTQVATVKFDKPGSYLYSTKEYPWSYGQIIVVPAADTSNALAESHQGSEISDQLSLGKASYAASCSACHGSDLSGRDRASALSGPAFGAVWAGRDALDLFDRIRLTMPQSAPSTLSNETYAAIVAYILAVNNNPASVALDRQTMKGLTITTK
jgi:quinohemoprotein ethanol dehydrogenase